MVIRDKELSKFEEREFDGDDQEGVDYYKAMFPTIDPKQFDPPDDCIPDPYKAF